MTQAEIVALIQNVHEQYAVLFAQALTVSFAVIVATYYFLHRTSARFRVAVLFTYLVGMLAGIVAYMLFWWRPAGGTADDVR